MTFATAAVLSALTHGLSYGFEIVDRTGLRAGTVYPVLRRLEERGLVRASWEPASRAHAEGRPPRRHYRVTREGRREAEAAAARFPGIGRMLGAGSGDLAADPS